MNRPARTGGYVLEIALRVTLLLLVLGQVVYLASRYKTRIDVTQDGLYSLTASTRKVLSHLKDRMLIECYFSKDDKLPLTFRQVRLQLENMLDEYVQLGNGNIVIQKFDPQQDSDIKDKAKRLGIQPVSLSDQGDAVLAVREVWQGVRLRYGGKQEVIKFLFLGFNATTAGYEAVLTPKMKALSVVEKPTIGVLAFGTEAGSSPYGGGGAPSKGFNQLGELPQIKGRYELKTLSMGEGQLVPDDIHSMLLIRPKKLTDRQKYAIDQFVMRGGNLVVFADTNEYEIGQQRSFRGRKISYDAPDSKLKFVDQLAHYGVKVGQKIVCDALQDAQRTEPFNLPQQTMLGMMWVPISYPYWFHPLALDYAKLADQFARMRGAGDGDSGDLAEKYRKAFKPGVDLTHDLMQYAKDNGGPSLFWPCEVELADKMPDGVEGRVLMRSSPISYLEDPPPDTNPIGMNRRDGRAIQNALAQFRSKWQSRVMSEPRQQFGLMVNVKGKFTSFFEGKEIPPRKKPEQTAKASPHAPDPLAQPIQKLPVPVKPTPAPKGNAAETEGKKTGETPGTGSQEPKTHKGEVKNGEAKGGAEKKTANAESAKKGDGGDGGAVRAPQEPAPKQEPAKAAAPQQPAKTKGEEKAESKGEEKAESEGEEKAESEGEEKAESEEKADGAQAPEFQGPKVDGASGKKDEEKEPAPLFKAEKPGQILVIGDSDFIRDDLLQQEYGQAGPVSLTQSGHKFMANLVDWLGEDRDLLELRNKPVHDRRIQFVEEDLMGSREDYDTAVKSRGNQVRWLNTVVPPLAILLIWLLVGLRRRSRKQMFLASVK